MKTITLRMLAAVGAILWQGLAAPAEAASRQISVTFFGNVAIDGYDPVAYFEDGKSIAGTSKFQVEWKGAKWRFASADHRDRFQAAPEKYAPQFGGYCAYQVAMGDLVDADPEVWRIEGDKLYLFYDAETRKKWLVDVPGFIAKAERNWPGLTK